MFVTDCTQTVDGQGYAGTVAVSQSGATCQAWSSHSDTVDSDQLPDVSVEAASNYCRNPDGKTGGVWCYIGDTDSEWEHCDLAVCAGITSSLLSVVCFNRKLIDLLQDVYHKLLDL